MRNQLLVGLLFGVFGISCSRHELQDPSSPDCINKEIAMALQNPAQNPRGSIQKYLYQGQIVYLVNTVKKEYKVYNTRCDLLCYLGGIEGENNNLCVNWSSAKFLETVWTDPR